MFTKYGIHTLANITIADPMRTDLLPWSCTIQRFATSNATQAKERSYCNWHLINEFLPLAIEVFDCLYKHANVFLHNCANVIWSLKRPKGFSSNLDQFSSQFFFDHITKDINILHLKLNDSHSLSYFLISTPLEHISHHHNKSITSCQLLTRKYGWPITSN